MTLTEQEIYIIKLISSYSVIDELTTKEILDEEHYLKYLDNLDERQKMIIGNFVTFKNEILTEIKKDIR